MGLEIERKFLIKNDAWKHQMVSSHQIRQGYLNLDPERTVRVRISDEKGILTIKGQTVETSRLEFEYEIPVQEAEAMLKLSEQSIIEKTRYNVMNQGTLWEIDLFEGDNEGLQIAEVELKHAAEKIELPDWAGEEVSHESKYYNACLITQPYTTWQEPA